MLSFYIITTALTLLACLAVLLPFIRARTEELGERRDIDVYRRQLSEIAADEQRGLIGAREASEARTEVGRHILKSAAGWKATVAASTSGRWIAVLAIAAIPLVSWGIYSIAGSPELPAQPLAERLAKDPSENTLEELIVRAEQHLAEDPEDGRGWNVIAPIYVRVGRHQDAVVAYRNAIRLLGDDVARLSGLGEALTAANGGIVSLQAQQAFEQAIALQPRNAKARFFLAVAKAQGGRYAEAVADWRRLVADTPEDSPWRAVAEQAAARAAKLQEEAGAGPSDADIAAAGELPEDDRMAMIEGMVANLAARLEESPDDPRGWEKLIRSYVVLGRPDEAKAALRRGRIAIPEQADRLTAFARDIGLKEDKGE